MGNPRLPVLVRAAALAAWIAVSGAGQLNAQCTYSSSSGTASTSATYNPASPASQAPSVFSTSAATTAPSTFMPVIPAAKLAAWQAAQAQNLKSSFTAPPLVQVTPAPIVSRAPAAATPTVQTPTYSWQAIQQIVNYAQPSPDIAVGPTDVIMGVNGLPGSSALGAIAQFTRSGTLVKQVTFQNWFAPLISTICPAGLGSCQIYDPVVRYDELHGRFLFLVSSRTIPDFRNGYTLLSVSNGASFNSGWKIWLLNPADDNTAATYGDYWRLSYDSSAVYLSGNLFSPLSFQYAKIRVLKKSQLYNPAATTLTFTDFWNMQETGDAQTAPSLAPVQQRGAPLNSNSALFVNAAYDTTTPATFLTVWKLSSPLSSTPAFACFTVSGLMSYTGPLYAPQAGGPALLDTGDNRLLKAVSRGGFIYTTRDAQYADVATTATYDVIDTSTMTLSSETRILNANTFYPAFDVPASTAPGAPFATADLITGTTTAPNGSLTYAGISSLKPGEDYFYTGGPISNQPWGDYFGGAVDPVSGGLWTSGEYAKPQASSLGVWGTWAGYFPWLTTPVFSDVDPTSPFSDYINVLSLWQVTSGCAATPTLKFCPGDVVTREQMAALIIRSMLGATFSYTTTPYFTDVPATDVYFPYVQKLRDLGITSGCSATRFCPGDPTTRWSAAILVIRGKMASLFGDNFTYPTTPYFTDVPSSDTGFPFVQKMFELGITSGCATNSFCPNRALTRQEVAVFLVRAFLN